MMAAAEDTATAFVETNLGTRIAVSFPAPNTTVAHLKRIVSDEHAASFARTGQIAVEYFEVRRRGSWYHLADAVPVRAAFHGVKGAWHLHAHVLPHSAPATAAHSEECNVHMLHHALCSQQNAIGDTAASAQGSDAPSTDRHAHLGDAHEDGYSPVRGQGRVMEDPRGRKRVREKQDGDRDQSVLVSCDVPSVRQDGQNECTHNSMPKRICAAPREDGLLVDQVGTNIVGGSGDVAAARNGMLEDEGALDDSCCHDEGMEQEVEAVSARPSDLAEPPADLFHDHETKSITNDEEPKLCFSEEPPADQLHDHEAKYITNDHVPKLCFLVEPPADELHDHEANSITNDEAKSMTNDEEPKLCFSVKPPMELRGHEAKSVTNDAKPKLCFSVNENDSAAATEKHADEGMTQEKLVEQQDHLDTSRYKLVLHNCNSKDTSAVHCEHVSDWHQHEGPSRSFCKSSKCEMLADQVADRDCVYSDVEREPQEKENDHRSDPLLHDFDDCARSLGEEPICGQKESSIAEVCNSASRQKGNDLPACVETSKVNSSEKEAQEKLVEQQDHLDTPRAEVVLQNCNSKDPSAIHCEHQHEGPSRSFCKSSKCEMLTDQVADHDCVCSDVERAPQEKENDHRSDPLLHDLDDCARSLGEEPICGQKEPSIAQVRNTASSEKGNELPACAATLKVNSLEKEAMARKVKGKEPLTAKVCNGERSSSKGTDRPPRARSMKEGKSSEKEEMAQKVKDKEPWTAKACNSERSSSKGSNQSIRTVTLVDVDGTKWEMELDDSFELGPQESSSFSWSEKEDAEEIQNDSAIPHQNAEQCPEGAPENGGPSRVPTERSNLPRHGSSFRTPTSIGPTESKHAGATSADDAEHGAWEKKRRPRAGVRKIPNSRAAKMYDYR